MKQISIAFRIASIALGVAATLGAFSFAGSAVAAPVNMLSSAGTWFKSAGGFAGAPATNGELSKNRIIIRPTNLNAEMIRYIAPAASPLQLEAGQQLLLSFTYRIDNPLARTDGLRLGLFNSNASPRVSQDYASANAKDYTGYLIATSPASGAATATSLFVCNTRQGAGLSLVAGSGNALPKAVEKSAGYNLKSGDVYNGFLSVAYVDKDNVRITYTFDRSAEPVSWLDSAARCTAFDTFAISIGRVSSDANNSTLYVTALTYEILPNR